MNDPLPVPARIVQLLHAAGVHPDATTDTVLTNAQAWLPAPEHGVDALWDELPDLRARLEQVDADREAADDACAEARARVDSIGRVQAAALAEDLEADVPSRRDAEEALDVARARQDAAAQRFAQAAVDAFLTVREREAAWRGGVGAALAATEKRERELEEELDRLRTAKRGLLATGPWLDAARDARWVQPFHLIADQADARAELEHAQAYAAANPPDTTSTFITAANGADAEPVAVGTVGAEVPADVPHDDPLEVTA